MAYVKRYLKWTIVWKKGFLVKPVALKWVKKWWIFYRLFFLVSKTQQQHSHSHSHTHQDIWAWYTLTYWCVLLFFRFCVNIFSSNFKLVVIVYLNVFLVGHLCFCDRFHDFVSNTFEDVIYFFHFANCLLLYLQLWVVL